MRKRLGSIIFIATALGGCGPTTKINFTPTIPLSTISSSKEALDCLAPSPTSAGRLTLPFIQSSIDVSRAKEVAVNYPVPNKFFAYNGFSNMPAFSPLLSVSSWWAGTYNGLPELTPANRAAIQFGSGDAFGHTSMTVQDDKVGLWFNSLDTDTKLPTQAGSGSLNVGCNFLGGPTAPLFRTDSDVLDMSFETSVEYDGSQGANSHAQEYINMIIRDTKCEAAHPGGAGCGLNVNITIYVTNNSFYANYAGMFPDATGTAPYIIVQAGIDADSTKQQWFSKAMDSASFQTTPFTVKKFHMQSSVWQFSTLLAQARVSLPQLSPDPKDYEILTFNVIGEGYEACKDPGFVSGGACAQWTQLGFWVRNMKLQWL
ncbi:MAG: hypothetical protein EOP11_01955 [Proteobacteria bacterium]|nr:MAG: hypothetical protein EOP11_01955 [Pseudomonadota bacterium]